MNTRYATLSNRVEMRASVGAVETVSPAPPPGYVSTRPWWATDIGIVVIIGGVLLLIAAPFILGYYVLAKG